MNKNLLEGPWICDTCGAKIESAGDGCVEWLDGDPASKSPGRGMRLVHHCTAHDPLDTRCQYNDHAWRARNNATFTDSELCAFLGPDGLMTMLQMILTKTVLVAEVVEMIKRLHVPGYERARLNLEIAKKEGVVRTSSGGYPGQSDIEAVNAWVGSGSHLAITTSPFQTPFAIKVNQNGSAA